MVNLTELTELDEIVLPTVYWFLYWLRALHVTRNMSTILRIDKFLYKSDRCVIISLFDAGYKTNIDHAFYLIVTVFVTKGLSDSQ